MKLELLNNNCWSRNWGGGSIMCHRIILILYALVKLIRGLWIFITTHGIFFRLIKVFKFSSYINPLTCSSHPEPLDWNHI